MTDPQTPSPAEDRPAPTYQPPVAPAYGAPAYSAPAYPGPGSDGRPQPVPGRTLGIVAFILSFFLSLAGLIVGIVAIVQSRRAGQKNGFALAAIILSSVFLVLTVLAVILVFVLFASQFNEVYHSCMVDGAQYAQVWGSQFDCSNLTSR